MLQITQKINSKNKQSTNTSELKRICTHCPSNSEELVN